MWQRDSHSEILIASKIKITRQIGKTEKGRRKQEAEYHKSNYKES